jgi:hypothetical protein
MNEPEVFTIPFKDCIVQFMASQDPETVTRVARMISPIGLQGIKDLGEEEVFIEDISGFSAEPDILLHVLLHVDNRPSKTDTVYHFRCKKDDLKAAKELTQVLKAQIRKDNHWGPEVISRWFNKRVRRLTRNWNDPV